MNKWLKVSALYFTVIGDLLAGNGGFEAKIENVFRHDDYLAVVVAPKFPEYTGMSFEASRCTKLAIDIGKFNYFKWGIFARVFNKDAVLKSDHEKFLHDAVRLIGRDAYFSLMTKPKRLSACHIYVDGAGYWIKNNVIDVSMYYDFSVN